MISALARLAIVTAWVVACLWIGAPEPWAVVAVVVLFVVALLWILVRGIWLGGR